MTNDFLRGLKIIKLHDVFLNLRYISSGHHFFSISEAKYCSLDFIISFCIWSNIYVAEDMKQKKTNLQYNVIKKQWFFLSIYFILKGCQFN